jgi:diguanylate cyclase (GGDEF)-like protein
MLRIFRNGLSLRLAGRFALIIVGIYIVLASVYSAQFLDRVETGAGLAREQQIPLILSQNRIALKVERAASLMRSVYLAHDRRVERQVQLQLQTLTQSFTLDDNQALIDGGRQIAVLAKQIAAQREIARELRLDSTETARELKIREADTIASDAYQQAIRTTDALSDSLARDAVQVADGLASTIEDAARQVRFGWLFILTLPAAFLGLLLWVVSRHILQPITAAVSNLNGSENAIPRPVFTELRTVTETVEAYSVLSVDLKRTNEMLLVLSDHDGLTGLLNRRAFEEKLTTAFANAINTASDISVLMLDLDHFKSINDTHGHEGGDACLRDVASVLKKFASSHGFVFCRYGGEEFCAYREGESKDNFNLAAELRATIENLRVDTGGGNAIRPTASIGISSIQGRPIERLSLLVSEADRALYQAKHAGRNMVVLHQADLEAIPLHRRDTKKK